MKTIDLHTHTVFSDGSMTPEELVLHAKQSGLSAVAVSDHDSVGGVGAALSAGADLGIEVVPAVELSAQSDTETHVLGYFIDYENEAFKKVLRYAEDVRRQRLMETCEMLEKDGFDIRFSEVEHIAGSGILCRAHIAKLMEIKGYSPSPKEAFRQYLNVGCKYYSSTQALTDVECVTAIKQAGGLAFLAHLHLTKKHGDSLLRFIEKLKDAGLDGVEGYYTDYTPEMHKEYTEIAQRYGLLVSGGTDFHGDFKPHISIGRGLGDMEIPYSVLESIKERKYAL